MAWLPCAWGTTPLEPLHGTVRDGVRVELSLHRKATDGSLGAPVAGEPAQFRLRLTDEATGNPIKGARPAAWLDRTSARSGAADTACRERVGAYLRGNVGMRPLVDFNSYFLWVMNQDASISVIDPFVGITGKTNLLASIPLPGPALDWVKSRDGGKIFVAIPRTEEVVVIDTNSYRIAARIKLPAAPSRLALQPDGNHVWVGLPGGEKVRGQVMAIDADRLTTEVPLDTGQGHHEFAFSAEDGTVAVSNRTDGTLSLIDLARRTLRRTLTFSGKVIDVEYSALARRYFVSTTTGSIESFDANSGLVRIEEQLPPGLGPLHASADGRWVFALDTEGHRVHIIDTSTGRLASTAQVENRPYQAVSTGSFVHIRSLDSEKVSTINLIELAATGTAVVNTYAAGSVAPGAARDLPIADGMASAATDTSIFVASPGDAAVYFYMEGMNATAGAFRGYGHSPRAVAIVSRAIREVEPGVYATTAHVPVDGRLEIALMLDAPRQVHCLEVEVAANSASREAAPLAIEFIDPPRASGPHSTQLVRFRLIRNGSPEAGMAPRATYFLSPGSHRGGAAVREASPGIYEAAIPIGPEGVWHVHVSAPDASRRRPAEGYVSILARQQLAPLNRLPGDTP